MDSIGECHESEYGCQPEAAASAPGRFHLLGEHTWFAGGLALSMAIDLRLSIAISPRQDSGYRVYFATTGERKKISPSNLKYRREDRWVNSLKSVITAFIAGGEKVPGLNISIQSEIPLNTGLGVPNAMKVGLALALRKLLQDGKRKKISDNALISLIETANERFLSIHPHREDLFCAFYAKKGSCIKTDLSAGTFEYAAMPEKSHSVILVDTKVPRVSSREELGARIEECSRAYNLVLGSKEGSSELFPLSSINESLFEELSGISQSTRRMLAFIINEAQRVESALQFLRAEDFAAFSKAVIHSHEGLRDGFEISCPELDWIVKRALEFADPEKPDLVCARMTGRGFGGCAYAILPSEHCNTFIAKLGEYERIFDFTPLHYIVKPSGAATVA